VGFGTASERKSKIPQSNLTMKEILAKQQPLGIFLSNINQ